MEQWVVLNLGPGDWQQGCAIVTAQLWLDDSPTPMQVTGSLPAAPEVGGLYSRWKHLYEALYAHRSIRSTRSADAFEIEEDETYIPDVSEIAFRQLCQDLYHCLNTWLNADSFRTIDRRLRTYLKPTDAIRVIITAENHALLQLPWHLWAFFEDYSRAELALSLPEYRRAVKASTQPRSEAVRILAILGNSQGINLAIDQQSLEQLPQADLHLLVEPTREVLNQQLWEPGWDLLFFAGHSSSQGRGQIQINRTESLTLDQLRFGLKKAIERGLKLAIFNSCDGLELAWSLADLQIPQVIVMREPVPDRVAQAFLQHFLVAFSGGESFYLSVREAREKLQPLEAEFHCATWLPVICQNPAEVPPRWEEWCRPGPETIGTETTGTETIAAAPSALGNRRSSPSRRSIRSKLLLVLLSSLVVTGCVGGVRLLGWLQPLELWAFDRLLTLRPLEPPDSRFLMVTIGEADIQAQNSTQRRGSLSDEALEQLLQRLESYQPRVIGLDVYRDFPTQAQHPRLLALLRQTQHLVAICKSRDRVDDLTGIAPPPEMSGAQIGFSDFLEDPDGVLRRQILTLDPDPASPCASPYSFSARLAFRYLDAEGVSATFTAAGELQLGSTLFQRLRDRTGAYQTIDAAGNQVLLNYRSLRALSEIAPQVTLTQVLTGQVRPEAVKDRLVLVGVTANSSSDFWATPYGVRSSDKAPGVFIQAHMASQLISAVLDQRSLIWVWSGWNEALWIFAWALVGGVSVSWNCFPIKSSRQPVVLCLLAIGGLTGLSMGLLNYNGWVPLIPAGIALTATAGMVYLNLKLHV